MELDTVLRSNLPAVATALQAGLSKYITPELGLQLSALKQHMGVDNFAFA